MLGNNRGSSGRVIILGDGTETHADSGNNHHDDDDDDDEDGDIDMEDRGGESEEDKDLEEQVKRGQAKARSEREETPAPVKADEGAAPNSPKSPTKLSVAAGGDKSTSDEPKTTVPVDGVDNKAILEGAKK